MAENFVLNRHTTSSLLSPAPKTVFATEEQLHSRHTDRFQAFVLEI
jgi:hypothetical protein